MKKIYIIGLVFCFCNSLLWGKCKNEPQGEDSLFNDIAVLKGNVNHIDDNLMVSIELRFDKPVSSNKSVVLRPLISDTLGNLVAMPSIFVNGRRQQIYYEREVQKDNPGSMGVRRTKGAQNINYIKTIPFEKWMKKASLTLQQQECGCNLLTDKGAEWISDVAEQIHFEPQVAFRAPTIEQTKLRSEYGSAFLNFVVNQSVIRNDYMNNRAELNKLNHSLDAVKQDPNVEITSVKLHGYASPDGPYANNERLGKERMLALKKYVLERYDFQDSIIIVQHTAEDWEGFISMLRDTTFNERDKLLSIALNKSMSPDGKERKMISKYPSIYKQILKDWFPKLRHADYEIDYVVRPFTLEESKRVYVMNPKNLSIEELFKIAKTYEPGSAEYNQVFETTVTLFPDSPEANLNAACAAVKQGKIDDAKSYMKKALECPEKILLQGVLKMEDNRVEDAISLFKQAESFGLKEATENLRQLGY